MSITKGPCLSGFLFILNPNEDIFGHENTVMALAFEQIIFIS